MIKKLTDAQIAAMEDVKREWLAIGMSTEPANREAAEDGMRLAYKEAGLDPPKIVIWLGSPIAGVMGCKLLKAINNRLPHIALPVKSEISVGVSDGVSEGVRADVREGVRADVWDGVRYSVAEGVWDSVSADVSAGVAKGVRAGVSAGVAKGVSAGVAKGVSEGVSAGVRDRVSAGVWDGVWEGVSEGVWEGVRAAVWDGVCPSLTPAEISDSMGKAIWGNHEAGWMAFYDYFQTHCFIDICNKLDGLSTVAKNAGWWFPFREAVILTERPRSITVDEYGRSHSYLVPAIMYPDGWSVWCLHGTYIPNPVIHNKVTITGDGTNAAIDLELQGGSLCQIQGVTRLLGLNEYTLKFEGDDKEYNIVRCKK